MKHPRNLICFPGLVAAIVATLTAGAVAQETLPSITSVNIRTTDACLSVLESLARRYGRAHPDVQVRVRGFGSLYAAGDLASGKADLAVVLGGDDILAYPYKGGRGPKSTLGDVFKTGQVETHVLARLAMAVVVHPENPLSEISVETLQKVLLSHTTRDIPDPLASHGIRYIRTGILSPAMRRQIMGPKYNTRSLRSIRYERSSEKVLAEVAGNPKIMAFMLVNEKLWGSGLKILPVRCRGGKTAILPTASNVLAGKYPCYTSLLLAIHPKASSKAREVAKAIRGERVAGSLTYYGWITRRSQNPGTPTETIWPAILPKARPADVNGSVAVLPLKSLSPFFRMADASVHARYEQEVTEGITAAGPLKLLDRAELRRILTARRSELMFRGKAPDKAIIASDILVLIHVVTRRSVPYLQIQAFHSATASCLGAIELPIDPARPALFSRPLKSLVRQWWPGVVNNLAAAQSYPIWTLLPTPATAGGGTDSLGPVRASLTQTLAGAKGIFFARYAWLPAAQREVLMRLMGLSRPASGRFTPAADYLLGCRLAGKGVEVCIQRGKDLQTAAGTMLHGENIPDLATAWVREQMRRLKSPRNAGANLASREDETSAKKQADLELARGLKLKKQYDDLQAQAYRRYRKKNLDTNLPEDRQKLDALHERMLRCFERAVQLDPTREKAAFQAIALMHRKMDGSYGSILRQTEACLRFVDTFPKSSKLRGMMEHAFAGMSNLGRYVERPGLRNSRLARMPPNLDYDKLAKKYCRDSLHLLAEYMELFIPQRDKHGGGSMYSFNVMIKAYFYNIRRFRKKSPTEAEMEDVFVEYGLAIDPHPTVAKHSDFLRLEYLAEKKNRRGYLDVLRAMQNRWSKPDDPHWTLGADDVVREMSELFQIDPRANSFYQWRKGRRGPGDLPYVGYEPKKDVKRTERATSKQ